MSIGINFTAGDAPAITILTDDSVQFDWNAVKSALEKPSGNYETGSPGWWVDCLLRVAHAAYLEGKTS